MLKSSPIMIHSMLLVSKILDFPLIPYWSKLTLILELVWFSSFFYPQKKLSSFFYPQKKIIKPTTTLDSALNLEKSKGTEGKYHKQSNYSTFIMQQIKWDVFKKRILL